MSANSVLLLSNSSEDTKLYDMHLVPCKIRATGHTNELANNLEKDTEESADNNSRVVTYIRGRKVVGKSLACLERFQTILLEPSSDPETSNAYRETARIGTAFNYEREGNESRLQEELSKFEEYLQLTDVIHD
ncbi:LAQU0S27e00232g1_1 [Lachancea quebecensis]|uniref:LAQU0S27e00232g1_1 n=1 Tax=Lachancea quebecensis TaxID=1654605 RepID=A0A0P1KYT3_9SACH|nr:LAQU0S27e00232g1_1 [Lachancea quebecensis]